MTNLQSGTIKTIQISQQFYIDFLSNCQQQGLKRMKIHSLEIINFKSYLGQHVIGPFDEHFTCIIGPNGNGKSNILDAMLFVFGFKSSKLRQDSLASLIHSSAYGTPQEAKVSVTFVGAQNTSQRLIKVSRTIRKNNNSFYQLNQKRIQWNQLRQFLLKQCIDLQKNLFIILQGEVQRLCELSPQKLVEYIEYVSGSDQYLQRITKLQSDYVVGGIEMERVRQSYGMMKKVYCQQEKEGFQLLDHIRMRIQLVELGVMKYKKAQTQEKQSLQQFRKKLITTKEELTKIQSALQQENNELAMLKESFSANTNTMVTYDNQISKINDEMSRIQSEEIKKFSSQIEYLMRDKSQKQKQINIVERQKAEVAEMLGMEEEFKEKADEVEKLIKSIIGMGKDNDKKQNQLHVEKSQKKKNKNKHQQKLTTQQNQNQSNRKLRKKVNTSQNKYQELSPSNNNTLGQQYIQLRNIHKLQILIKKSKLQIETQFNQPLQSKESNLKLLKETLSDLVNKYTPTGELYKSPQQLITSAKIKLRHLVENQQKKQKEIVFITQSLQEINNRIVQKETQKTFLTLSQKIIHQIKTANKYNVLLPGRKIITLREVIHISLEHAQFINPITPQLDWIIVENHNDAREIINFLTSKKLGRMSLILMDEVKKIMTGVSTQYKGEKPKGCVRMIDVVKPLQNQYEKILFWAVGNTLIADTSQDGMKAAYQTNPPHRVICKNGVFIDLSGTMTKIPLQTMSQEDKSLLDTRQKVLQKKLEQETRKVSLIRQQKQQSTKQLQDLINSTNKSSNLHRQQFTTKQQLLQFMKSLTQEIIELQKEIMTIKGNKATHELDIKLKEKDVAQMVTESKQSLMIGRKVTFQELMQLVEEYENILARIKKINISEQLLNSHHERLLKANQQIKILNQQIQQKEKSLDNFHQIINTYKHQVNEIEQKKRLLIDQNYHLEQKIFVKELDIKHLKGQIMKETKFNDVKINNFGHEQDAKQKKRYKKFRQERLSQLPNMDVFSGKKKKVNNKNKDKIFQNDSQQSNNSQDPNPDLQKTSLRQSLTIIELRKQQKRLSQEIQVIEKKLKTYKRFQKQGMDSLRNICQFLLKKCRDGETQRTNETKEIIAESSQSHIKNMEKSIVNFQDLLINYFKVKGIEDVSEVEGQSKRNVHQQVSQVQNTLSQSSCSNSFKSKSSCLKLKSIISQSFKFSTSTQKLIFNCLFNALMLVKIGPNDEYHFTSFLTTREYNHLVGQQQCKDLLKVESSLEEVRVKQDLLNLITMEKLKLLEQSYHQKLIDLEKHSSSLLIKNIQHSPIRKIQIKPQYYESFNQSQQNTFSSSRITYFSDSQFPLISWQWEIIDSLIHKKNEFLSTQRALLQVQRKQKGIYSQLLLIRQQRSTCYLNTFNSINIQVNKIYNFLTKGNAEMNLLNSINPFEGIEFSVRPFNKSWKSVNLLSGGQKTLTSLALIFACEEIKKFPFYFMDEIDAALDYRNVTNLGRYIKSKENVQHIVISLRKNMYEQCDQLVCIYKVSDVTRTIVIGMKQLYGKGKNKQKNEQELVNNSQSNASTVSITI